MSLSPERVLNGLAWAAILVLIALALALVRALGFPGVLILGLLTGLVCTRAELSEESPSWGVEVFRSRTAPSGSAEARAARDAARRRLLSPLLFGRACGLVLIVAGLLGTAWEALR